MAYIYIPHTPGLCMYGIYIYVYHILLGYVCMAYIYIYTTYSRVMYIWHIYIYHILPGYVCMAYIYIYHILLGYACMAYIYIPHTGMRGNTKFSIHLPSESSLRSPIIIPGKVSTIPYMCTAAPSLSSNSE